MTKQPFSISVHLPILALVLFVSFFAHLGSVPLFDMGEGIYSEISREMLANQDFTTAYLNGKPYFHQPILFYWIQAATIKVLGLNELALRLPSAIGALVWTLAVFMFVRRLYDFKTAWYAAIFMSASLHITIIGKAAMPDSMLNLFISLTMFNIWRYYSTRNKRFVYWAFMFAGLGVLTKGLIAVLIPFVTSIIFYGIKRQAKAWSSLIFNPVGLVVFFLITLPWYLGEYMLHGEAFLNELLLPDPIGQLQNSVTMYSGPIYYYLPIILLGVMPYTVLLIKILTRLKKLLADDNLLFMAIWFILVLVLFSFLPVKHHTYILTGYAPLFVIMARTIDEFKHLMGLFMPALFIMVLLFFIPDITPHIIASISDEYTRTILTEGMDFFDSSYRLFMGVIILLLTGLPFIKPIPLTIKNAVLVILFLGVINFLVVPITGKIKQQPLKTAAKIAKRDGLNVVTWHLDSPSFNVYFEQLTEERLPESGEIVLTKNIFLEKIGAHEVLFQRHGIVLAKVLKN
jgi:4-amino-4-deoxy-L-arabinose transferase-like glycosyltransferase